MAVRLTSLLGPDCTGSPIASKIQGWFLKLLKHFEQSLAAVSELRVPPRERVELVLLVDDYVFGFTLREILQEMYEAEGDPDMTDSAVAFFEAQLATGEYSNVSKLMRGDLREAMERLTETFSGDRASDRRFERGLKILFDGFEKKLS